MANERPGPRPITQEEFERRYASQPVRVQTPDMLDRIISGGISGASMHLMPQDEFGERDWLERLPRTTAEAAGSLGALGAATYGASRLPVAARRGPLGWLARLASRAVDNVAERPGRAAAWGAAGVGSSGLGAAVLPDYWDSPYAEPVGGVVGSLAELPARGAIRLGGATAEALGLIGSASRAGSRRVARAADSLEDFAGTRLNPDQIDEGAAGLRTQLSEAGMEQPQVTLGQATQNPGIAAAEASASTVGNDARAVRASQDRALENSAFTRGPVVEADVSAATGDALRAAVERSRLAAEEARAGLPNVRLPGAPIFNEVGQITAGLEATDRAVPRFVRDIQTAIQRGGFDQSNGTMNLRMLIGKRDELDTIIRNPRTNPLMRERAERMVRGIDASIATNPEAAAAVERYRGARTAHSEAANTLRSNIANQVSSSPVSFRNLVNMVGDRHAATELARDLIERRARGISVGRNGEFDGAALQSFLSNPSNASLMEAAFGPDHVMRLRTLSQLARRLDTDSIIPRGGEVNAGRRLEERARAADRNFRQIVPAPLDAFSGLGMLRRAARMVSEKLGISNAQALNAMVRESLADPDFASTLLRQNANRRADHTARLVTRLATRYAEPAAESERIGREQESSEPGVIDSLVEGAENLGNAGVNAVNGFLNRHPSTAR